ncbi:MAG: DMT family transporter [Candidatus Bathyarchaeota archaeon]|nr:DMT family transporter [Candidatus Bathyarchaeota archaeon]
MIGIVLALLSAAASGLSVILVRRNSATSNAFNVSLVITVVGMVILWPLAIALNGFDEITLTGFVFFAVSGVLSPGIIRLLYYQGLRKLGASVNSSVYAAYPLYSALLAVLLLGESLSTSNILGIVVILVGIVVADLSISRPKGQGVVGRKNLIFPILAGVTFGVSHIIRKYALNLSNTPVLGVSIAYAFSFLPFMLMLLSSDTTRKGLALTQNFRWFWAAGVGQAAAWLLAFYAFSFDQVSIVTPLISIEPLFVVSYAFLYMKKLEYVSPKLFVSIALTVVGVALVMLG